MLRARNCVVELHHAVALGVVDVVGVHHAALRVAVALQQVFQAGAVEDVVAEHERHFIVADKVGPDHERLRQPVGHFLHRVLEAAAQARAVAEQALKLRLVVGRGDDEHLPDARHQQDRERVVHHRLVVHRHQLLANGQRERVEARAGAAGEDDSFHGGGS